MRSQLFVGECFSATFGEKRFWFLICMDILTSEVLRFRLHILYVFSLNESAILENMLSSILKFSRQNFSSILNAQKNYADVLCFKTIMEFLDYEAFII